MKGMTKYLRRICLAGLLMLASTSWLFCQQSDATPEPTFYVETLSYASDHPGKSRIDLYLQVPYEELRFIKENDLFVARFDVTLTLSSAEGQSVLEQTWTDVVRVKDFTQTTSNRYYSLTHRPVEVDPGNYQALIIIQDQESKKTAKRRRNLVVSDFSKEPLSLSDIMLVNRLSTMGDKKSIVPNISGYVGHHSEGFFLFVEVYETAYPDSVLLTWKILDNARREVAQSTQIEPIAERVTQSFLKVENLALEAGGYLLVIEAKSLHNKQAPVAKTQRFFSVRWSDLPSSVQDLDKAIDQMRYVARESEMQFIRDGKNGDEKRQRFLDFWRKRDPDPRTPDNEVLEEYYARVAFSNRNFSHYIEGWRTDRGMVYIYLGPPDNIEHHPFDNNSKPFDVWYYNQANRQYIFVDESGFGDYRLRSPLTDLWNQVR
jgi:GWxTD domain-containing protein